MMANTSPKFWRGIEVSIRYLFPHPWIAVALALSTATPLSAQYVEVGGDGMDGCGSNGVVINLNSEGGDHLSVRAGPGVDTPEVGTLRLGADVFLCDQKNGWHGIVYGEGRCGVSSPVNPRMVYRGPCSSGWVPVDTVEVTAG